MASSPDLPLTPQMPACAALPTLAAPLLDEAIHCAACAIDQRDPELIHRFRVSLRQLRSLLWAYAPLLPAGAAELWRVRLGELASLTSTAREWTVMATELAPAFLPPDPSRARSLLDLLDRRAERAMDDCRRALLEAAPTTVLALLQETLTAWSATQTRTPALGTFAAERLRDAYRILAKRAARRNTSIRALHRTRIAVKRVHYLTLLFTPVLAPSAIRRVKSLKRLQLHLGRMNDAAAAIAQLRLTSPPLCGHRMQRLAQGRLSRLSVRCAAQARHTLARSRKRLKP